MPKIPAVYPASRWSGLGVAARYRPTASVAGFSESARPRVSTNGNRSDIRRDPSRHRAYRGAAATRLAPVLRRLVLLACLAVLALPAPAGAVIGGSPAGPDTAPWAVALVNHTARNVRAGQFCAGSVIAPTVV